MGEYHEIYVYSDIHYIMVLPTRMQERIYQVLDVKLLHRKQ